MSDNQSTETVEVVRPARRDRVRRIYRVRWQVPCVYKADRVYDMVRHFQTKGAAERHAQKVTEGREEQPGLTWDDDGVPEVPPAVAGSVHIDVSEPVVFPPEGITQ